MNLVIIAVVGGILAFIVWMALVYNRLITLRNRFKQAFATIDVQLKRRHDLIPNLVEAVKGYMAHERGTLEAVAKARAAAVAASSVAASDPTATGAMTHLGQAEGMLLGHLGRLVAVAEANPDLKSSDLMKRLMEDLTSTENRIAFARQAYNDFVMFYNTACSTFPVNLISGLFSFAPAEFFEITNAAERSVPEVKLS